MYLPYVTYGGTAVLIREALAQYVRSSPRPKLKSLGIAKGDSRLAERTDELLAGGFGER